MTSRRRSCIAGSSEREAVNVVLAGDHVIEMAMTVVNTSKSVNGTEPDSFSNDGELRVRQASTMTTSALPK